MGGSIGEGNTTASAEFNIVADPEAADVVFRSGVPITMIGLDVTHQALLDRAAAARAARPRHPRPARSPRSSRTMRSTGTSNGRAPLTTAIHDAVAIAHLMVPDLVAVARYHVVVDTTDGPARGRTVCDGLPVPASRAGRWSPTRTSGIVIDRERFTRLLVDAFSRLP